MALVLLQSPKNKSQRLTKDIICIIHTLFCVALNVQVHTPLYKKPTDPHCHLLMHVSHSIYNMRTQGRPVQTGFPEPGLPSNRTTHFSPCRFFFFLRCDGVQAVYKHDIWQNERSSGGYCVILSKWPTP